MVAVSQGAAVTQPAFVIRNRTDMARVMKEARVARGLTLLALDHECGSQDGYSAKLENPDTPSGKRGLQLSFMAEVWLQALGYVLAVVPQEMAESLGFETYTMQGKAAFRPSSPTPPRQRPRSRPVVSFRRTVPHGA